MPTQTLFDQNGRPWRLDRLLAQGGEGAVHRVADDPARLAKLYRQPPSPETVDKLGVMARAASAELCRFAAWPTDLLHDRPGGRVVGFLMPHFADYQPLHHLYNPAQRLKHFPRADWAFLVQAARNCAAAFDEVHRAGCVVGDINQSNVLVSPRALIGLIDCDSFQVRADGRMFLCEVGVPLYTPPELQGKPYRGLVRTPNHDGFGLAVLLFQLLFMGRHPYAGRYLGPGDPPFEQLIAEYRFAYGPDARALQMERPPHTPALADAPPELAGLFERAFRRGSEPPGARPAPAEWLPALERFQKGLRPCPTDPGHKMPAHLPGCPWCRIVQGGGPDYFKGVAAVAAVFTPDQARLSALTARLDRLPSTAPALDRASYLPRRPLAPRAVLGAPAESRTLSRLLGAIALAGLALLLAAFFLQELAYFGAPVTLVFGVWWLLHWHNSPWRREIRARRAALRRADRAWRQTEAECRAALAGYFNPLRERRRRVEEVLGQCRSLASRYRAEHQRLERNREALLREEYLRGCFLSDHDVPGIGPGRKQVLASYGIETAFDVEAERVRTIKGFGNVLTGNLTAWKQRVLAEFHFDPKTAVPEGEVRALALQFRHRQGALLAEVERGVGEMESLAAAAGRLRVERERTLQALAVQWAQARADLQVMGR